MILVVPKHEQFQLAAAVEGGKVGFDLTRAPGYPGVELDASFAPVPLGSAEAGGVAMEAAAPAASEYFAVRGHLTAAVDEVPHTVGDAKVYSDPRISEMLTCGGSPPVGKSALVANKLHAAGLRGKHLTGANVAVAVVDTGLNLPNCNTRSATCRISTPALHGDRQGRLRPTQAPGPSRMEACARLTS